MKRSVLLFIFLFLIGRSSFAFDPLTFYSSARPMGMGGAFIAVADDANALFYNPAGLGFKKDNVFASSGASVDQDSAAVSGVFGIYSGALPFKFILGANSIHDWTDDPQDSLAEQQLLAFPYEINDDLSISIGYKKYSVSQNILTAFGKVGGSVGSATFGLKYRQENGIDLGLYVDNIIKDSFQIREASGKLIEQNYPAVITIGAANHLFNNGLLLAFDISYSPTVETAGQNMRYNLGCEYNVYDWLSLRSGYATSNIDDDYGMPTIGLGIKLGQNFLLDLASAFKRGNDSYIASLTWRGW